MAKRILLAAAALAAAAAVTIWFLQHQAPQHNGRLRLSGTIETTQVELAFKIPGRLAVRLVDEGQSVKSGEVVARLADEDQQLRLRQAEAELHLARARLLELENGSRPEEIEEARAALQQAQASAQASLSPLNLAQADSRRYASLLAQKVISQRDFDLIRTTLETAQNQYNAAVAQVRLARARHDLVIAGPRAEVVAQARANVSATEQRLGLAQQQLIDTQLIAPLDATVLSKSAEPGAYLNPGTPVLTLGDLAGIWLRAYIAETDLGRVRLMQPAQVFTDTYPDKAYAGKVVFIAEEAEFTPKAVRTYEERVKLVYRVKIALANPDHELKPGMPADAVIELGP